MRALDFVLIAMTVVWATPSVAEEKLFNQPKIQAPAPGPTGGLGIKVPTRLDWCYQHTKNCGRPAAAAFCKMHGFQKVISWQREDNVGNTVSIGDNMLCTSGKCDGFVSVLCFK